MLANIFHVPGLTQQALAEKLLVGRSAMSMLLPVLGAPRPDSSGAADEADKRLRLFRLTPEGEALTQGDGGPCRRDRGDDDGTQR